jgi:hypothetical protein
VYTNAIANVSANVTTNARVNVRVNVKVNMDTIAIADVNMRVNANANAYTSVSGTKHIAKNGLRAMVRNKEAHTLEGLTLYRRE